MKNQIVLISFSGILLGLAQQPLGIGFVAWFGLIPWIYSFRYLESLKSWIFSFFIWGFVYHLTTIYWLAFNIGTSRGIAIISLFATIVFLSTMILPAALIMWFVKKRWTNYIWIFPIVWVVLEYFRSLGTLAFPWVSLANTQTQFILPIQIVEITGIYGVSFWIVTVNILIYFSVIRNMKYKVLSVIFFLTPWVIGMALYPTDDTKEKSVSVSVIQPNIPLDEKWDDELVSKHIDHLIELSIPEINDDVDLIVWPETATPVYLLKSGKKHLMRIQTYLEGSKTTILSGIPHYDHVDKKIESYNSITMFNSDEVFGVYKKIQLVPMAEYVPLSGVFPQLSELNFGQANFTRGETFTTFPVADGKIGAVVCFESTIPQLIRHFVRAGAGIIAIVTNDGWYENPPEPQQHAKQAIFRAIENRKPVIRSANTGLSMIIDPTGNIRKSSRLNEEIVFNTQVYFHSYVSFYTKWGDIFAQFHLALLTGIILFLTGRKIHV
ncbi:MAG: apolipoprotein N-acyltransferase [Fidelibacterota bacterium]